MVVYIEENKDGDTHGPEAHADTAYISSTRHGILCPYSLLVC